MFETEGKSQVNTRYIELLECRNDAAEKSIDSLIKAIERIAKDHLKLEEQWRYNSDYLSGFHAGYSQAMTDMKEHISFLKIMIKNS